MPRTKPPFLRSGYNEVYLGIDPEFFFKRRGKIIGSERILPEEGIRFNHSTAGSTTGIYTRLTPHHPYNIVRDGVQAEINLQSGVHCRALVQSYVRDAFRLLTYLLAEMGDGTKVCFDQVVTLTEDELGELSAKSKTLGCLPSKNIYDESATIGVDPATYKLRSAGGHIHVSYNPAYGHTGTSKCQDFPEETIKVMDILVGNTSVLLDRSPLAKVRREVYGRAGEYRTPSHGVEYRTLSNFWLRDPIITSLVLGLARLSAQIVQQSHTPTQEKREYNNMTGAYEQVINETANWSELLFSAVDQASIREAINTNSYDLAWKNWQGVRAFIKEALKVDAIRHEAGDGIQPLQASNLADFEYFLSKKSSHWFKLDPMTAWLAMGSSHGGGWENFLIGTVRPERLKEEAEGKKEVAA